MLTTRVEAIRARALLKFCNQFEPEGFTTFCGQVMEASPKDRPAITEALRIRKGLTGFGVEVFLDEFLGRE